MAKTITITLYKYDELSEDVQKKVLEKQHDINVDHNWWEFVYEDASNIGVIITGFDIGRAFIIDLTADDDHIEVAQAIAENWGVQCDGYAEAEKFIEDFKTVSEDGLDDLEQDFKRELKGVFLRMLQNEYEYRTSKEAIIESIKANDYDFTEAGDLY